MLYLLIVAGQSLGLVSTVASGSSAATTAASASSPLQSWRALASPPGEEQLPAFCGTVALVIRPGV